MYFSRVTYFDGKTKFREKFPHVEKAEYDGTTLSGDEMLTHVFPIDKDLHLFSKGKHCVAAHKNIVKVEVSEEENEPT